MQLKHKGMGKSALSHESSSDEINLDGLGLYVKGTEYKPILYSLETTSFSVGAKGSFNIYPLGW